ncbi:MAG TPA: hypothetical protein VGM32_02265 [Rhodopila sp.]|jgi:hypothetical protein
MARRRTVSKLALDIVPDLAGCDDAQEATLGDGVKSQETQKDLLDRFRHAPVRMPRSGAELFRVLALYNPQTGWDAFLGMIDFTGVAPRHIHQVLLGRHPGSADSPGSGYDPRQHFRDALLSRAFRERLMSAFLHAYPSTGRDVFIHVPKCAGTDLILNLGSRSLPIPKMLEVGGWTSDVEFIEIVSGLARAAITADRFFVYGHMELGKYADVAGVRPDDRIFTVLRDPIDLMVSQANYVIGRIRQDPRGREPDAAEYLHLLDLTHLPEGLTNGDLKELTLRALLNPLISEPNRASYYLGSGSGAIYTAALKNLIVHNVEITTTKNYDRWLAERWGITEQTRHNRSEPILANAEARRLCAAALDAATQEDRKLYDLVSWALLETGRASITGQEVARLGGLPLAEGLGANACPPLPRTMQNTVEQNILVAEAAKYVEVYLAVVSAKIPGTAVLETIVEAGFGANQGGEHFRLEGWARAEESFTWTAAHQCSVQLPRLRGEGRFVVRLIASPFVVKERLPLQQVELLINGVRIGSCEVKDVSVIEAEVPAAQRDDEMPVTVVLRLPTATRPNAIGASADDRLLALAVRSMTVFRIVPPRS